MVRHNNMVPVNHFHKDWQRWVRTWFNQPAKKASRRVAREARAARLAPRPVDKLRPAVRCMSRRYNMRVRLGRGFSRLELKTAGIAPKMARTIGIAVDHRRQNKSQETLNVNVARLKKYMSNLILFPRRAGRVKKGDSTPAEQKAIGAQNTTAGVLGFEAFEAPEAPRAITDAEKETLAYKTLRTAIRKPKKVKKDDKKKKGKKGKK